MLLALFMIRLFAKFVRNAEFGVANLGLGLRPAGTGGAIVADEGLKRKKNVISTILSKNA